MRASGFRQIQYDLFTTESADQVVGPDTDFLDAGRQLQAVLPAYTLGFSFPPPVFDCHVRCTRWRYFRMPGSIATTATFYAAFVFKAAACLSAV